MVHAHFKRTIPSVLYGVGFPIFPPVSSADCNISMSNTITTTLEHRVKIRPNGITCRKQIKKKGEREREEGRKETKMKTHTCHLTMCCWWSSSPYTHSEVPVGSPLVDCLTVWPAGRLHTQTHTNPDIFMCISENMIQQIYPTLVLDYFLIFQPESFLATAGYSQDQEC